MKRTFLLLIPAVASALCLSNCSPTGLVYHNVTSPVVATASAQGTREGRSQSTSILGLVAYGDSSIAAAKKNGGITTVSTVDIHHKSILTIYHTFTTIVTGN